MLNHFYILRIYRLIFFLFCTPEKTFFFNFLPALNKTDGGQFIRKPIIYFFIFILLFIYQQEFVAHQGTKPFRIHFVDEKRVVTIGTNKTAGREISLWNLVSIIK